MKTKKMYMIWFVLVLLGLIILSGTTVAAEAKWKWVITDTSIVGQFYQEPTYYFCEEVERRTGGQLKIEYLPAQFGTGSDILKKAKLGLIQMASLVPAGWGNLCLELQTLDLPYLFTSIDQLARFKESDVYRELLDRSEKEIGLKIFDGFAYTSRVAITNNKRIIHTPDDLKGLKIRECDFPCYFEGMKCMGASPVLVNWFEVYQSIDRGLVDGVEVGIDAVKAAKIFDICKYLTLTDHGLGRQQYFVATLEAWNSIPEDIQKIVEEAAISAARLADTLSYGRVEETAFEEAKNKGVEIYVLTPEEKEVFRHKVLPFHEKWVKRIGNREMYDKILQAAGVNK